MKKGIGVLLISTLISSALFARGGYWHHQGWRHHQNAQVAYNPYYDLSKEQKDGLKFMFEEEKLARDVYITLGKLWNHRTFLNIQKSEQRHMNAIKRMLEKYDLPVPATEDEVGKFENEDLQALYNELIAQGKSSLADALNVGVLIEETDIKDLKERIENAPADIKRVYSNLMRGSYHHLRAFNYSLNNLK